MISAGQQYPAQQTGYPAQTGYPGYQQQGPMFQQPQMLPIAPYQMSGPNIKLTGNVDSLPNWYWYGSAITNGIGAAGNIVNSFFNYSLSGKAINAQKDIAIKYYATQDSIAGRQEKVALRQLGVQENAIFTQQAMHGEQTRHEEVMARLEGATQARLARISEDGRTERAKILSVSDAFSRRGYDSGTPLFAV